ncbi:MAG: radical SAM protein [Clostridiales bacterium]|nr:radical SAM protein [Clostridiales bacterium]
MICNSCPRMCSVERNNTLPAKGFCKMPYEPFIARAALHKWEEPCISGINGSGTIFFSGCSLRCAFCQNEQISRKPFGRQVDKNGFIDIMKRLEEMGAHNINLVNPTHFVPFIKEALEKYKPSVPVVYNTGGYERAESIKTLDGLIDIYLPDLKYVSPAVSKRYSSAENYFEFASKAILEMHSQVGECVFDGDGILQKGLIIRHLVLPGNIADSFRVIDFVADSLPKETCMSLMSQYTPMRKYENMPELNRRLTTFEYEKVLDYFRERGLENAYIQQISAAKKQYIPDFSDFGI